MTAPHRGWFYETCAKQMDKVWNAVHGCPVPTSVAEILDLLVPHQLESTGWPSHISDDHTPYEISLLLGADGTEIRLMAEPLPLSGPVTLADTIHAASRIRPALEALGADFQRFDRVAELFLPPHPQGLFAIWYAASFTADGAAKFKVYFNPAVRGRSDAPRVVEEALSRLGVGGGWAATCRALSRGPSLDALVYFSLDLSGEPAARVKVYGAHREATFDVLEQAVATVPGADLRVVRQFCRALLHNEDALVAERQPATCLAFVGDEPHPRTATVHIPIRAFVEDDATARSRVQHALEALELGAAPFEAAVAALSPRPLEGGRGLVAWAAVRTGQGTRKANVYLAPKALFDEPTCTPLVSSRRPDPEAIVRKYEEESIAAHPFFARVEREPFAYAPLALFVFNVREAITRQFARRLSSVIARVEEDAIRSVLAKQLNDELGDGDPSRTHKLLFEQFASGFPQEILAALGERALRPGLAFGEVQEDLYVRQGAYEGVGATLLMEVLGKQGDLALGRLLRRSSIPLPEKTMEWLVLHEELEVSHVNESFELARLIPPGKKAEQAVRGAEEIATAAWRFLDELYLLSFSA